WRYSCLDCGGLSRWGIDWRWWPGWLLGCSGCIWLRITRYIRYRRLWCHRWLLWSGWHVGFRLWRRLLWRRRCIGWLRWRVGWHWWNRLLCWWKCLERGSATTWAERQAGFDLSFAIGTKCLLWRQ